MKKAFDTLPFGVLTLAESSGYLMEYGIIIVQVARPYQIIEIIDLTGVLHLGQTYLITLGICTAHLPRRGHPPVPALQ